MEEVLNLYNELQQAQKMYKIETYHFNKIISICEYVLNNEKINGDKKEIFVNKVREFVKEEKVKMASLDMYNKFLQSEDLEDALFYVRKYFEIEEKVKKLV